MPLSARQLTASLARLPEAVVACYASVAVTLEDAIGGAATKLTTAELGPCIPFTVAVRRWCAFFLFANQLVFFSAESGGMHIQSSVQAAQGH